MSASVTAATEFEYHPPLNQSHDSEKMRELLSRAQVAIIGDDPVSEVELQDASSLSLIVRWGAGLDNVDIPECSRRGIKVVNTPGLFGHDVADMAIGMALGLVRRVVDYDRLIRLGEWPKGTTHSFRSLSACVLGVGAVGREICRALLAFGLDVTGYDLNPSVVGDLPIKMASSAHDASRGKNLCFVTLPLTDQTRELVGKEFLENMGSPSYLINVSRGEIVDEEALLSLLDAGSISGAALDVFQSEPLDQSQGHHQLANIVLSAHNASNTFSSIRAANNRAEELIADYLGLGLNR